MKTGLMAAGIALLGVMGLASASFAGIAEDIDSDLVYDVLDNCSTIANAAPNDCDRDDDGYGSFCDGDFDQNNAVNANDLTKKFVPDFKPGGLDTGTGTDMDCNGAVNANDFTKRFVPDFGKGPSGKDPAGLPGPSGLHCAGTIPCDL